MRAPQTNNRLCGNTYLYDLVVGNVGLVGVSVSGGRCVQRSRQCTNTKRHQTVVEQVTRLLLLSRLILLKIRLFEVGGFRGKYDLIFASKFP